MPLWLNYYKLFILNTKSLKDVSIINELGLHARSAAKIAKLAQNAKSTVWVIKGEEKVDASSILDILTLAFQKGSKITLKVNNKSDIDILNSIVEMVEKGFEE